MPGPGGRVGATKPSVDHRPSDGWAKPVEGLDVAEIPAGARTLNVQGRRLFGPVQGFGQLWQKTYRIGLRNTKLTPQEVVATWKQTVPKLKPLKKRFYPSSLGITPNALVLIDAQTPGGPLSTGVMGLSAGAQSFPFLTPTASPHAGGVRFS